MFMDENKIDIAMNDKRVKMNELYDGKLIFLVLFQKIK